MLENIWVFFRGLCAFCTLMAVSYEDFQHYKIPRKAYAVLTLLGIIDAVVFKRSPERTVFAGILWMAIGLLGYRISKGKIMGGGDLKLLASSAFVLGVSKNFLAFFIACVSVILVYPARKKLWRSRLKLAFAPYLSFGIMVSLLWGDAILCAYRAWPGI